MPQKLCFLIHLKNPHTVPDGWSKTKVKKRTSTSEEIMPFRVISFVFKLHCIFCGETCSLKSDPHNPSRWQAAYLCKTASRGTGLSFKNSILEVCGRWKDAWANQVEVRLQGAISDLHAAEARYYDSCRKNFMLFKIKETNTYASQEILIWHLISLWKTSLATSQLFGHLARCMKTTYCMVAKDASKLSLQNCKSILMTNWLFSLLQDSPVFWCFVQPLSLC